MRKERDATEPTLDLGFAARKLGQITKKLTFRSAQCGLRLLIRIEHK
jgi:hypothetical protein